MTVEVTPPAVALRSVHFAYAGGPPVLVDVTLDVAPGGRLGIFGPNGGGKSTLLKVMLGMIQPQRGNVEVFGTTPGEAVARGWVGYLPQRTNALWQAPLNVHQVVQMAATTRLHPWQRVPNDVDTYIDATLDLVGISSLRDRPIGELSGGQQQRVFIARALAGRPRLLILDEPTVGIDAAGRDRFLALLDRVHTTLNTTCVLVSHDLRVIRDGCDSIAVVANHVHLHRAPKPGAGITDEVLKEVFHHDIVGHGTE